MPLFQYYAPQAVYTEKSKVQEETLRKVISNSNVEDAVVIYNLLVKKEIGKLMIFIVLEDFGDDDIALGPHLEV